MQGQTRNDKRPLKFGDEAHFLKALAATPRLTGAVAPSGRALARAMAAALGHVPRGLVVELGPGTGPVTRALVERGLDRRRLVLIEYDRSFCRLLEGRFAPAKIIQGDAYDLPRTLAECAGERIAAVVSSLPLLNQPPYRREKLIGDAFDLMGPEGVFVQFTYGLLSPIPREACAGRYSAHCGTPIWRNLPPARVWTYRLDAHAGRAESPARGLERAAARLRHGFAEKSAQAGEAIERRRQILRDRLAEHAANALRELRSRRNPPGRYGKDDR
jgi:phosphatidylethanolamine/phosphatidyl-N-methylethanolamine N-methyltransferase